jgi:hypothetical protein
MDPRIRIHSKMSWIRNTGFLYIGFAGVIRRHRLQYNPNLCEEGVRGRLDPHGLVLVLACGTLHNHQTVCGVFEQVFFSFLCTGAFLMHFTYSC